MPKVTLEFEVKQTGVDVKTVTSQTEQALAKLGTTAVATARQHDQLAQSSDRAGLSARTLRAGINDVAAIFGSTSPAVANVAIGLGHVADRMSGVSTSAKILGGTAIGAATAIGILFTSFKETERIAEKFASIDRAVKGLDVGTLTSGIKTTNIELETMSRQGESVFGRLTLFADSLRRAILGLPSATVEATQALDKMRAGLGTAAGVETQIGGAQHAAEVAGLQLQGRQQLLGSLISQNLVGESSISLNTARMKDFLNTQYAASVNVLNLQFEQALAKARSEGVEDILGPMLRQKLQEAVETLGLKRDIATTGLDEQARQQIQAAAGRTEASRAFSAGQDIERQNAYVDTLKAQQQARAKESALNEAFLKKIGVSPILLVQSDPNAKLLIEEEKKARLMAIDETLKKDLYSIDQLRLQDSDRVQAVAQAQASADQARQAAMQEALNKERDLEDSVQQRLTAALAAAGGSIQTNLTDNLERARQAAENVADASRNTQSLPGSAFQSATPGGSQAWKQFWAQPTSGVGSEAWWQAGSTGPSNGPGAAWNDAETRRLASPSRTVGVDSPGGVDLPLNLPSYDEGGTVPGPPGRPQLSVLHGGETVTPPGRGTRQPVTLMIQLAGKTVATALLPDLQQAIADGALRLN